MSEQRGTNAVIMEKRYEDGFRVLQGQREYVTYPDNTSVRIWYSEDPWRFEEHVHSAVEIVLTLEGSVEYVVDGVPYTVRKDEVLVIPMRRSIPWRWGRTAAACCFCLSRTC